MVHILVAGRAEEIAKKSKGVAFVPPGWIFGDFCSVEVALKKHKVGAPSFPTTINVVWGCGGWGHTQALAEIARGGWGLVTVDDYLAIRPDASLPMNWTLDFEWSRIVPLAKLAPRSEYSSKRR